ARTGPPPVRPRRTCRRRGGGVVNGLHVLRRELRALVTSPQTYAIAAAYLVLSGIFFLNILITSQIPDLEHYYSNIANTLLVLVPVEATRSFAERRRTVALH